MPPAEQESDRAPEPRVDRSVVIVEPLGRHPPEREYWWSRTPEERLAALQFLREVAYGHDEATARLQRVLTVSRR